MRSILPRELDQVGGCHAGHRVHDRHQLHPRKPSNLKPFMPYSVRATVIMYFTYSGFDNIVTMAEEIKNQAACGIPLGFLGSMSKITVIYYVMMLVLSMIQLYQHIDRRVPYLMVFIIIDLIK
jgi:amino acid transporter